jgi:glycosyltransferase involved in cell wall biosynthesis
MVTPYVPYPPVSGGRSRTYNLVRRLARYFSMTVVCFGRPEEQEFDLTPMREMCELIVVDRAPSPTTRQAAWLSLTSPRPITMRLYSSPQMRETIENLLKTRKFDLVHVESFYTVQNLPQDIPVPLLLSEPAIEYLAWWRHALVAQPLYQRPGIALEALKMRIVEPQVWTQATLVGVMSEFDEQIIRQATPGVPTTLAPNGVDIEYFQADGNPREGASALFLGDFKYFPNTDAMLFFIQEIMPLIRAERPDFTLTLLGKDSPPEIVAYGNDPESGVYVEGLVEDTRPYLSRATMFVCPLRSGSGTRFKLLESLACECPVVSTSIGCEGLDPTNGRHMLVADTPRSFADAVLKLINNPEEAERLGHHGRNWVVERHSWERSAALVGDAYMRLIGSDDKTIPGRIKTVPVRPQRPRASG